MTFSTLVFVAGVAALCAGQALGRQSSSPAPSPVSSAANSGAANSGAVAAQPAAPQPASNPPSVSIGADQIRPVDGKAEPAGSSANPPAVPAPAPAATKPPATPVPNPNPAPPPSKGSAASRDTVSPGPPPPETPYVIGPLDVLEIRVWNDPKLSGMYPVRPDGMISMPLIGEFKADGLNVPQMTAMLKQKLTSVMNEPEVNIQVVKINSKRVFVFGGVMRAGEMPIEENMTVLDALSNVGFKEFANTKKITIMRGTRLFHFNYNEVSRGRHMEQNIYLQNGDRIFVPE